MTPLQRYAKAVADGTLKPDSGQERVMIVLSHLAEELTMRETASTGILGRIFNRKNLKPLRGIYIHGEVGRGKTMLMDMFFDSITPLPKRRVHFHAFMQDVHARRNALKGEDVINNIADDQAEQAKLLCLDEMQIADIADAMIIGRLFDALHERGVCFVTTSNMPPEDLYRDGLNRQLFLPFIAKLRQALDVISLDSPTDYRLDRVQARQVYLFPPTAEHRIAFNEIWRDLTDGASGRSEVIDVLGRKRMVPKAAHGCAAFTFYELCGDALGPPDYLAIAKTYRTIFLSGLPRLKAAQRNETKRFILMIDTFYDAHIHLVILAEAAPEDLVSHSQHGFEFKRTVSRLKEMQSASWWTHSERA